MEGGKGEEREREIERARVRERESIHICICNPGRARYKELSIISILKTMYLSPLYIGSKTEL